MKKIFALFLLFSLSLYGADNNWAKYEELNSQYKDLVKILKNGDSNVYSELIKVCNASSSLQTTNPKVNISLWVLATNCYLRIGLNSDALEAITRARGLKAYAKNPENIEKLYQSLKKGK